jgi:hypothetical protein
VQPQRINRIITAVIRFPIRVLRERIFGPTQTITKSL